MYWDSVHRALSSQDACNRKRKATDFVIGPADVLQDHLMRPNSPIAPDRRALTGRSSLSQLPHVEPKVWFEH